MNLRDAFLRALASSEDDTTTRLVYADWLDEQGEHEEADRQRRWPAAKEWLVRFCQENSHYAALSYEGLIEFGRRVIKEESTSERVYFDYDNEALWHALRGSDQEFWKNWSIVTGIPLPPSLQNKGFHHWSCCAHEVYYWFGTPDSSDPEE
jgi:uncharacterized protein (TIGR02996 family)